MKENMLDVLLYLFENCVDDELALHSNEESIKTRLSAAGFMDAEISKAFHWLESLAQLREQDNSTAIAQPQQQSQRVYVAEEMEKISLDSRGLILFLEQMDVLKPAMRELVIDRIMALETDEIDHDGVKWVILMVLFNQPGYEAAYTWLEDFVFDEGNSLKHLH